MSGPGAQASNLADGRSMRRDVSRRSVARASTSRPEDTKSTTTHNAPPRQRTAEDERARAAAKQAEKEMWERTRGAGSSVFKLAESGRIKREEREGEDADMWKAEDVLPTLEEVENKLYEIVEVPSIDVLLSRGICDYTLLPKTLGRGKFSTVFIASKNGELSAIKHTALFPHHQLISTRLLREPTLLAELPPHPNLVAVKETIRTPGHFYLVEEYLGGYVTLEALLPMLNDSQPPILPTPAAESILTQLLSAVHSIHVPLQICHRDIKPENILVHPETLQLKLLDFGLATHYSKSEPKLSTCCGSPAFHCPEIVKALASPPGSVMYMGPEVDAWTCGVTMLRCLTGQRFPLGASHSSLRGMAIRAQRAVSSIADEGLRNKVGALLDMDSTKRMRKFEELIAEQEKILGEPKKETKKFKSTTFIPIEPTHSIKLPLLAPHLTPEHSSAVGTHGMSTPYGPASTSRRTTPASSRPPSPNRSRSSTPTPPTQQATQSANIVALNPTYQPPERILSYIKYCLRCAGILYHSWPDTSSFKGKSTPGSPVNYFGNQFPASSSGATLTASNTGFAEALASNHEYGHHPHHHHLHHNNGLDSAPVTPLFPPSLVPDERSDGFAHVQIFQCVMEVADEKEQKIQGGEQMSLVQSIMAAFGRKKPTPPPPSPSLRPDNRRSLSTPAKARVKDATLPPGTPGTSQTRPANKDGSVRCLTFHLIVRFPKINPTAAHSSLTGTTRLAPSRTSSSLSLSQQAASNNYTSHNRHSRANSVATPNHTYPEKASGSETGSDAKSHDGKVNNKRVSYDGHVLNRVNSKQQQQQQQREGETPTLEINTDIPLHSHHLQQQAFPRTTSNRSPSSSRAPSRSRKRSTRGHQKKPRVYFEVSDYRAMQVIRDALSVGGTIDSLETEDYFSTNHQHRQSLPPSTDHQIGEVGTPLAETSEPLTPSRGDQRRKPRSRTSTSTSRTFLLADSDYGGGGGGGTPRPSEDVETPRSSRMIASDEEERRGRQLNGKGAKLSKGGGVRAPSQLSTVALKEESPNNDSFKQSIESLNVVLQNIITSKLHNDAQSPGTPSSGLSGSEHAVSNTSIGSSTSSIPVLTAYMGGETGAQIQARTLLLDVSRRLHSAETIGPNALEDLISPLSFTLFSALSPALGLEPQETKGLPCVGGAPPTNVGEAVTLRGLAMSALDIVARYASPREMYLAAQERLEVISLLREAKSMADEGEKETLQVPSGLPAANESSLQSESQLSSNNDNWSSGLETAGLLHFLSITIPRIKTQKPDNFVQPLLTLIPRAVRSSLRAKSISPLEGPFSHLSSPTNSNPQTPNTESNREMDNNGEESANQRIKAAAGEVTFSLSALINSIKDWSDSFEKEEGEKAKTSMKTLLFACIIALVPELAKDNGYANLSDRQFHQWFPQYSFRRPTRRQYSSSSSLLQQQGHHVPFNKSESSQASVWSCLEVLISNLNLDLEEYAFQRPKESLALQDSSAIAIVTMGAFILQVNLLSRKRQSSRLPSNWTPEESLDKLKKAMPLLLASLGSGPPATISPDGSHSLGGSAHLSDTALTWILWCTHGLNQGKEPIILEESEILPLLQTTSSHAALCPDPSSRLISLTLVELLLDKNVTDELGIELLRDLIVESPFPQLKAASVGLAKRLISSDLSKGTSRYANRNFLQSISSSTFTFPSLAPEEPQEDFGASKTYLDDHGAWLSECLGFLYLLVAKDSTNQTGVLDESSINTIQSDLIQPLQNWLHRLTSSPLLSSPNNNNTSKEESELALQSTLLSVALDRAKEAIDSRPST